MISCAGIMMMRMTLFLVRLRDASTTRCVESLETRFLIASTRSDNTYLFCNFADKIKATPLQDDVHGHGMDDYFAVRGLHG